MVLVIQAAPAQLLDDDRKRRFLGREVEQHVAAGLVLGVDPGQMRGQAVECGRLVEVHPEVVDVLDELVPGLFVDRLYARELLE